MYKSKFIFKAFLFLTALCATTVLAQTDKQVQADPSYEVILQVVSASNNASEKSNLPQSLANPVKKLKTMYAFSEYRLINTYLQRTSGFIEYKSLLNESNQVAEKNYPIFSDWSLKGLRLLPNAQGKNVFQVDNFRFGARIPIPANIKDESGKTVPVVNYEGTYINTMRFSLNENEPTVIASLSSSKPDELMFFVLTVKNLE